MKIMFRQMLETALFDTDVDQKIVLLPQYEEPEAGPGKTRQSSGWFSVPDEFFPSDCRVCRLPGSEAFLQSIASALPTDSPVRIFVAPPLLSRRDLSDALRARFPLVGFDAIVLSHLAEVVPPGSLLGVILPSSFFVNESSRMTREKVCQTAALRLVIAHDHPIGMFGLDVHAHFRMGTAIFEKGAQGDIPVRFFKCPSVDTEAKRSEVLDDFRRLLHKEGGKTKYGYVFRDGVQPGDSWLYDAHHPDLVKRKEDLAHLGKIQLLGDLVEVK